MKRGDLVRLVKKIGPLKEKVPQGSVGLVLSVLHGSGFGELDHKVFFQCSESTVCVGHDEIELLEQKDIT